MQLNDLRVNLTLDDDGFKITVKNSKELLRSFEKQIDSTAKSVSRIEGSFTSLGTKAHHMVMSLGMARFALMDLYDIFLRFPVGVLKTAGEIERMTRLMEGLSKETDDAKRKAEALSNVKFAFNMAQNAPFSVEAITDSMVKLKTTGIDPTNGSLKALLDGVARFGGSSDQLKRASIAIQQMSGKGVISMEELRQQLGEAMPNAMQAMANGMNMTMAELTKEVSRGTVRSTMALKKMFVEMSIENTGAAARMMDTWTGMVEQLKTRWTVFQTTIADQGMMQSAKDSLKELIDLMGSEEGLRFGRDVGRSLKTITDGLIKTVKTAIEFSDTIVTIGKLWLLYWGAGKLTGPVNGLISGIKNLDAAVKRSADTAKARVAIEQQVAREVELSAARQAQAQITSNNEFINSEVAATASKRAELAKRLRDEIVVNEQIMAVYRQRISESRAADMAVSSSPDVQAVRRGVASPAQDLEAQVLLRTAEAKRAVAEQSERALRLLEEENLARRKEVNTLTQTTGALSAESVARKTQNNELAITAQRHQEAARAVTAGNTAIAQMSVMASNAIGWLTRMATSAMGLQIAIMLVSAALIYMSDKAREAKLSMDAALKAKNKLQERSTEDEDVQRWQNANVQRKETIDKNNNLINMLDKPGADKGTQERVRLLKAENTRLNAAIKETNDDIIAGTNQVIEKESERKANAFVSATNAGEAKALEKLRAARDSLNKKKDDDLLAAGGNESAIKKVNEKYKKDLEANSIAQLKERGAYLKRQAAEYDDLAKKSDFSNSKKQAYINAARKLREDATNAEEQIATRMAPNDIGSSKKGKTGSGKTKTDDVVSALAAEEEALLKAKNKLLRMKGDVKTLSEFQQQIEDEVDLMIENDRSKKVYTEKDRKKLISTVLDKKVIDSEIKEFRRLQRELIDIESEQAQLDARASGNITGKATNKHESQFIKDLRMMAEESTEAKMALEKLEPWISKLGEASAKLDFSKFLEGENKLVKESRIKAIVNPREQLAEELKKDLKELEDHYADQFRMASGHEDRMLQLKEKFQIREAQIRAEYAKKARTPLEKMADDWKDVLGNMEQATANWAKKGMDAMVELASGGKVNFREMVASMLKDLLRIQMQKSFGEGVKNVVGDIGKWAVKNVPGMSGDGKSQGEGDGFGGFLNSLMGLGKGAEKAADAVGTSLTDAVGDSTASIIENAVAEATTLSAEQSAAVSMQYLTNATTNAAAALQALASSAGGGGGGDSGMGMLGSLVSIGVSMFSGGGYTGGAVSDMGMGSGVAESFSSFDTSSPFSMSAFADGGVMTSFGPVALRKYANGGVANSPQMALYGEGSMNEAYVPLPDGRRIPVALTGGNGGNGGVTISIVVNQAEGTEKTSTSGDDAGLWTRMANRVKGVVQEEMVKQSRPGGVLYK